MEFSFYFFPFSDMSPQAYFIFFFFFFPTSQEYPCRDPSTVEYNACALINSFVFLPVESGFINPKKPLIQKVLIWFAAVLNRFVFLANRRCFGQCLSTSPLPRASQEKKNQTFFPLDQSKLLGWVYDFKRNRSVPSPTP